jgi:hypothetical protein
MRFISISSLLISLIFFSGCSLQKREYRKGYYLHWKKESAPVTVDKNKVSLFKTATAQKREPKLSEQYNIEILLASKGNSLFLPAKIISLRDPVKAQDCGDSLFLKDGQATKVKIIEISGTEIRYRRCDNLNGPVFVAAKTSVSRIRYSNGLVEAFDSAKKNDPPENKYTEPEKKNELPKEKKKPSKTLAYIAFACGMMFLACGVLTLMTYLGGFSFVPFMVLGAVFYFLTWISSLIAIFTIKAKPEKHSGKTFAWIGFGVVAVYTLAVLAILLFLLYGV